MSSVPHERPVSTAVGITSEAYVWSSVSMNWSSCEVDWHEDLWYKYLSIDEYLQIRKLCKKWSPGPIKVIPVTVWT